MVDVDAEGLPTANQTCWKLSPVAAELTGDSFPGRGGGGTGLYGSRCLGMLFRTWVCDFPAGWSGGCFQPELFSSPVRGSLPALSAVTARFLSPPSRGAGSRGQRRPVRQRRRARGGRGPVRQQRRERLLTHPPGRWSPPRLWRGHSAFPAPCHVWGQMVGHPELRHYARHVCATRIPCTDPPLPVGSATPPPGHSVWRSTFSRQSGGPARPLHFTFVISFLPTSVHTRSTACRPSLALTQRPPSLRPSIHPPI